MKLKAEIQESLWNSDIVLSAFKSTLKGLSKLVLHEESIRGDLDNCWAVVAEAIQTILRREGYPHPYEALKELTRTNESVNQDRIARFYW